MDCVTAETKRPTVYILGCSDGSLYVGWTMDLEQRLWRHNHDVAASYTASRRPVTLLYSETLPSASDAIERERQIKRWSRSKKEALITGDARRLKFLSRRRHYRKISRR